MSRVLEDRLAASPALLDEVIGVVLAGGLGRRLGGSKAERKLAGRPLLVHVADRLAPQLVRGNLLLNANDAGAWAALGLPIIADTVDGRPGPLAGVLAAMQASGSRVRWVISAPTDTPFLPLDLVTRLMDQQHDSGAEIVLAASDAGPCQVCGLWSVTLAADLAHCLAIGQNKVMDFVERYAMSSVHFPRQAVGQSSVDPFFNINTADDLAQAERLLSAETRWT